MCAHVFACVCVQCTHATQCNVYYYRVLDLLTYIVCEILGIPCTKFMKIMEKIVMNFI